MLYLSIVLKPSIYWSRIMSTSLPRPDTPLSSQPARDVVPRRLIVTASVVIFAVRDWSLWVLLREGPWGPPMRIVLGSESVTDSVDRTMEALLMWPAEAPMIQLKAGWQVQQDPEIVLRYLADMGVYQGLDWCMQDRVVGKETRPMSILKEPRAGDGILTLAEAALLYRAFFPADEQIDLSNLRRRFLATNRLEPLDEERPVRGRELDWRRVSRTYRYQAQED